MGRGLLSPLNGVTMENEKRKAEILEEVKQWFEENRCWEVEKILSILANPVRFHILCALEKESFSVTELMSLSGGGASNVSQQLKMMSLAGFVTKERQGKQIIYSLRDERIRRIILTLEELFGKS